MIIVILKKKIRKVKKKQLTTISIRVIQIQILITLLTTELKNLI